MPYYQFHIPADSPSAGRKAEIAAAVTKVHTSVTGAPIQLAGTPASIQLTLHRVHDGQASTVALVVTDGCGDWPTFFGGGPTAF